jgi:hypothetical protein
MDKRDGTGYKGVRAWTEQSLTHSRQVRAVEPSVEPAEADDVDVDVLRRRLAQNTARHASNAAAWAKGR